MERLTKTYSDGTHGASNRLPCGENSYDYKNLLIEKLGKYEDLEERLNKVYGDCDELLESMIELLEERSGVDIPDDTVKALLLINESVDFYKKCESLEKQGRLVKLPCKIGTEVYDINWWDNVQEKVVVRGKTYCRTAHKHKVTKLPFTYSDIDNFGKTVFLTKSEAEAKLKELRGGENE